MNATKLRVVYSTLYSLFLSNEPQRVVCSLPAGGSGQRCWTEEIYSRQIEIEKNSFQLVGHSMLCSINPIKSISRLTF